MSFTLKIISLIDLFDCQNSNFFENRIHFHQFRKKLNWDFLKKILKKLLLNSLRSYASTDKYFQMKTVVNRYTLNVGSLSVGCKLPTESKVHYLRTVAIRYVYHVVHNRHCVKFNSILCV